MRIGVKIGICIMALIGIYYIFSLLKDGAKLQRVKKKYHTMKYEYKERGDFY